MAYDCWAAPVLWETTLWSPDLPNPQVKQWVELNISPNVSLKAGKTYRIAIHTIPTWEYWDEEEQEWKTMQPPGETCGSVRCWGLQDNPYTRGHYAYGCHYGGSGYWIPTTDDLTFRVYDSGGVTSDKQETAWNYISFFKYIYAGSQTFTPEEDYTAAKIALMLCEGATTIRGYLKVKLQRVTMGEPGFGWVEGTKWAYIDNDGLKRAQEGTLAGGSGDPGYGWADGNYWYYTEESTGNVRRIEGTLTGLEGKASGQLSVNTKAPMSGTHWCYIDSSGKERSFEGSLA